MPFLERGIKMKECFGTIYPDLSKLEINENLAGKVFLLRITSHGTMNQAPHIEADLMEWDNCQHCESYRSCFDFSNAKLAMRLAVVARV